MIEIISMMDEFAAVPAIQVSFAPLEDSGLEPTSPFAPFNKSFVSNDNMSYRPMHLSPPPSLSPSPLRALATPRDTIGMQQAVAKSSEKISPSGTARRGPDLRKEVALKAHKSRQAERRALFLSKIGAPPSPTAVSLPKTPPDSPAVFHYSLPSPGLMSPLALFESLGLDDPECRDDLSQRQTWVEQVDFRRPIPKELPTFKLSAPPRSARVDFGRETNGLRRTPSPPSLDQITAHYTGNAGGVQSTRAPIPLPAFLNSSIRRPSPPLSPIPIISTEEKPLPRTPRSVGRLRFPERALPPVPLTAAPTPSHMPPLASPTPYSYYNMPPLSPASPTTPNLQVTTTLIPRSTSTSPVQLTEANLQVLNSRARTARDMLSALKRRTVVCGAMGSLRCESLDGNGSEDAADKKALRRTSAPAELPARDRSGFTHPVLALPGGF